MKVTIRGSEFILCAERAVFWPKHRAMFCSDLHWGREAYLQKKGFAVPEQSFDREAKILKDLLQHHEAKELWILGDFIHHPEGLHTDLLRRMQEWMESVKIDTSVEIIKLIPGNHDQRFLQWAKSLPLEVHEQGIIKDQFVFVHDEADLKQGSELYCFSGHLHPAFILPLLGADKVPCFWIREDKAYLPAFSRMAGGMRIDKTAATDQIFVITDGQVFKLGAF